jgi:hypothetical protein
MDACSYESGNADGRIAGNLSAGACYDITSNLVIEEKKIQCHILLLSTGFYFVTVYLGLADYSIPCKLSS